MPIAPPKRQEGVALLKHFALIARLDMIEKTHRIEKLCTL